VIDAVRERAAVAGAAARVRVEHHEVVRGEVLEHPVERDVDIENGPPWISRSAILTGNDGGHDPACTFVFPLIISDLFDLRELFAREHRR
jgi:hypothetical protein